MPLYDSKYVLTYKPINLARYIVVVDERRERVKEDREEKTDVSWLAAVLPFDSGVEILHSATTYFTSSSGFALI